MDNKQELLNRFENRYIFIFTRVEIGGAIKTGERLHQVKGGAVETDAGVIFLGNICSIGQLETLLAESLTESDYRLTQQVWQEQFQKAAG
jgi:hypothetical protein